jgi:hypothetical protein
VGFPSNNREKKQENTEKEMEKDTRMEMSSMEKTDGSICRKMEAGLLPS